MASTSSNETPLINTFNSLDNNSSNGIRTRGRNGIKVPSSLILQSQSQQLDQLVKTEEEGEGNIKLEEGISDSLNSNTTIASSSRARWTKEEDVLLINLVAQVEPKVLNWEEITNLIVNRNLSSIMSRWNNYLKVTRPDIQRIEPESDNTATPSKTTKTTKAKSTKAAVASKSIPAPSSVASTSNLSTLAHDEALKSTAGSIENGTGQGLVMEAGNDAEDAQALIGFLTRVAPNPLLPLTKTWTAKDDVKLSKFVNEQTSNFEIDWNKIAMKLSIGAGVVDCRTRWGYLVALGNKRRAELIGEAANVASTSNVLTNSLPIPGTIGDLLFNAVPTPEQQQLQQQQTPIHLQDTLPVFESYGALLHWDPSIQNHSSALDDFIPQLAFYKAPSVLTRKLPAAINYNGEIAQLSNELNPTTASSSSSNNLPPNIYPALPKIALVANPPIPFAPDSVIRGRRTQDPQALASTLFSPHGRAKKVHTCPAENCGAAFKRSEHLKRHYRAVHVGAKPFPCEWSDCGKVFSRRDNLQQMAMVHGLQSSEKLARVLNGMNPNGTTPSLKTKAQPKPRQPTQSKRKSIATRSPSLSESNNTNNNNNNIGEEEIPLPKRNVSSRKAKSISASRIAEIAARDYDSDDLSGSGDDDNEDDYDQLDGDEGEFNGRRNSGRKSQGQHQPEVEEEEEEEDVDADYDEDDEDDLSTPIRFNNIGSSSTSTLNPFATNTTSNHLTSQNGNGIPGMGLAAFPSTSTSSSTSITANNNSNGINQTIGEVMKAMEEDNQRKRKLSLGSTSTSSSYGRVVLVDEGNTNGDLKRRKESGTGSYERTQI